MTALGEFASASLVREEPEPPSNRAGAVRFGQSHWCTRIVRFIRKRSLASGSGTNFYQLAEITRAMAPAFIVIAVRILR